MKQKEIDNCCDMRGLLSFLILFLLSGKPMHGQAIAAELEKRKGMKPSPGTLYPALAGLRHAGFIKEKKSSTSPAITSPAGIRKTITYTLTPNGRKALETGKKRFCRAFLGVFPE
ncbi:MAG: helix-turn-helix transcriptional regulator [Candidatus Aenigmarchaeota archaeon]|nr:helix-turn-helix transcriptional regulator [Candidatus Aenigmarchaeota archaeon]